MRVVSRNDKLHSLCQEVLEAAGPERQWQLVEGDLPETATDLYIWDFEPEATMPPALRESPLRHLFLVDRKDLPALQAWLGRTDANVLLKPISRDTLTAFLRLAVSAHAEHISSTSGIRADRDEMLQSLMEANLKLQEFDHDRASFLDRALHDFRSPLTAINGYCDLLLNDLLGPVPEEQKDVIRRMYHSAQRLSQMSSAMYDLSVGRQAHLSIDRQEGDLEECIYQALHQTHSTASAKGISISTNIDPTTAPQFFDPTGIEQVLITLIENACKFTARGGAVDLAAFPFFWERRKNTSIAPLSGDRRRQLSTQPNAYRVDIFNTGSRIPDRYLHTLFQEDTPYSGGQDRSGGGLGLAICRMNISRHDGRIWAENRDRGPAFCFVLPLRSTKVAAYEARRMSEVNCER